MVRFSSYKVQHRRRREGRTDYRLRLRLLKSSKPRLVIRKYNKNISCQVVEFHESGDRTVAHANSNELQKLGWSGATGNIPSAYLTGLMCGLRAKKKAPEAVLDIGLRTSTKGSRFYAALKGFLDAGIKVPFSNSVLPDDVRISGHHIPAEKRPKNFKEIKEKVMKGG